MATFSTSHTCHRWRNFRCLHMIDVEKSEILHIWHVCDVENVAIFAKFIAIYAVLLLNLLFTLFCREISGGEKLSPKVHLWRKNDKYQVWPQPSVSPSPMSAWKVFNDKVAMQSFDGGAGQNETFYKQSSLQIFCRLQSYNDNNNSTTLQA